MRSANNRGNIDLFQELWNESFVKTAAIIDKNGAFSGKLTIMTWFRDNRPQSEHENTWTERFTSNEKIKELYQFIIVEQSWLLENIGESTARPEPDIIVTLRVNYNGFVY